VRSFFFKQGFRRRLLGALPKELTQQGVMFQVVLPFHYSMLSKFKDKLGCIAIEVKWVGEIICG